MPRLLNRAYIILKKLLNFEFLGNLRFVISIVRYRKQIVALLIKYIDTYKMLPVDIAHVNYC